MQITDIITAPWAIVPEKFLEIQAIYAVHARGDKIDIAAVEARIGKPLANDDQQSKGSDTIDVWFRREKVRENVSVIA